MTRFDKICAIITIPTGLVFLVLGVIGLFAGFSAHFELPPVLGFLPFFLGWTMCITTLRFWRINNKTVVKHSAFLDPVRTPPLGKFGKFLDDHPEYKHQEVEVQMRLFKIWLSNRELGNPNKDNSSSEL